MYNHDSDCYELKLDDLDPSKCKNFYLFWINFNLFYQKNIEQKVTKIAKILIMELFDKGMDFKEKTKNIRKERKVGRPKNKKNPGRPKQGLD